MKILHIHPSMAGGGIESMICYLANEMSKTEEVTVCSIFEPTSSDIFWEKLDNTVIKKSLGKRRAGLSFKILWKIFDFIRRGDYDVVNLHGMFYYYVVAVLLLHKKVTFFYTIHSDAKKENTKWDKRLFGIKRLCFVKKWTRPITISDASRDSFSELYNTTSTVIYNGVPRPYLTNEDCVSRYKITEETKVFIHAGRISQPKNQVVLCKVFQRLINDGENVVLLIAGSRQSDEIFAELESYFSNRIVYLGQREDVPQLMAYSHAMCLPSIWEGLPITLLESLSVGCIPICSSVGGIPNVIESGKNGFLSKTSSEEDYYETMKEFLALSQENLCLMRDVCRTSFAKYDIINTSIFYMRAYETEMAREY